MRDLLTIAEAAALLGCSRESIRRLIAAGRLPAERHGRAVVIRRRDLARVERLPRGAAAHRVRRTKSG